MRNRSIKASLKYYLIFIIKRIKCLEDRTSEVEKASAKINKKIDAEDAVNNYIKNNKLYFVVWSIVCFVVGVLANDINIIKAIFGK